jgi:RNA polymerase sigma-70 factor (family 1)
MYPEGPTKKESEGINRGEDKFSTGKGEIIDSELILKRTFQADSRKGFELLFRRYYQPLCSHSARFVYSRAIAEDIVMDVFSRFWQNRIFDAVTTSYRAYLFTTVRHASFAYLKSEFGREQQDSVDWDVTMEVENPTTPQQLLQYHELYTKIQEILLAVSPQSQKVFIMSRFEGMRNQRIADELDLSTKTVEGHITKVLSILRRSLRENGFISSVVVLVTSGLIRCHLISFFSH